MDVFVSQEIFGLSRPANTYLYNKHRNLIGQQLRKLKLFMHQNMLTFYNV
jgi:hypothetical protein